jgi:hypothetical protein
MGEAMKKMDLQVEIEYDEGYMIVGMGEAYTVKMLIEEFWQVTMQTREFGPIGASRREIDGTVVHGVTWNRQEFQAVVAAAEKVDPPPKILEERGRGTLIRNGVSQGKLLQYWAWAQSSIEVGIMFPNEDWKIEYWMNLTLQGVPDDQNPATYPVILQDMCIQRLSGVSQGIAQIMATVDSCRIETRYLYNNLRVWFCPTVAFNAVKIPLAENPIPKDKWYSWTDLMAFTYPPVPEVHEEPTILFGPGCFLQERYADEEVQGGKIALIAVKQNRAQKPPNGLDRTQSTFLKQIAYNQRVLEAEGEIAGINSDASHFLSEMITEEPVFVCINCCEEMKRNEEAIAGQLWIQGDRQMTASNRVFEGMVSSRDSALLSAPAEAVQWRHPLELPGSRKVQRFIIYPKDLPQLDAFLSSGGDQNVSSEDGHPIALDVILQESQKFEVPPTFLREDSEVAATDPRIAGRTSTWMALSRQVAVGNRRRVLENGDDKMNSSDEDDEKMKPDELTGMYTAGLDSETGPIKLSQSEAARQRAAAKAAKLPKPLPPTESFRLSSDAYTLEVSKAAAPP